MEGQEPAPETHVTVQETITEEPEEDPAAESVTVRCIHTLLGIPIEYFKLGMIYNNYCVQPVLYLRHLFSDIALTDPLMDHIEPYTCVTLFQPETIELDLVYILSSIYQHRRAIATCFLVPFILA